MSSIADRLTYWRSLPIIEEGQLATGVDGLETRAKIKVGSRPFVVSTDAVFHGVTAGFSIGIPLVGSMDIGGVRGHDTSEVNTLTCYSYEGVRIWAETQDVDTFMDSAAYIDLAVRRQRIITLGGKLSHPSDGVPELKMEYLQISGPNGGSEGRILVVEHLQERTIGAFRRLGLYLKRPL